MAKVINESSSYEMWYCIFVMAFGFCVHHEFFRTTIDCCDLDQLKNEEIKGLEILIKPQFNKIEFGLILIAALAAFIADCLLIYILKKFKRLRKLHQNDHIYRISKLNIRNVALTFLLLAIEIYRLSHNTTIFPTSVFQGLHLIINVIHSLLFAEYLLTILMTMDWYIHMAHPSMSATFRKYSKRIIMIANVYVRLNVLCSYFQCLMENAFTGFTSYVLFRVILSFSVVLYLFLIVRYIRSYRQLLENSAVYLYMSLFKVSVWLFLLTYDGFLLVLLLAIMLPLIQLIFLFIYDRHYKVIAMWMFRRQRRITDLDVQLHLYNSDSYNFANEITALYVNYIPRSFSVSDDDESTLCAEEEEANHISDEDRATATVN